MDFRCRHRPGGHFGDSGFFVPLDSICAAAGLRR
jgi:hypothetical protein